VLLGELKQHPAVSQLLAPVFSGQTSGFEEPTLVGVHGSVTPLALSAAQTGVIPALRKYASAPQWRQ